MGRFEGTVLLVDDEVNALIVYGELLREWGHEVLTARGALEAMELMRAEERVDVAVVDLVMPHPGGMALFRWIREARPGVPVIILTAHGSVDSAVEAISRGAFHYLSKPPDPNQFRSIVDKAMTQVAMAGEITRLKSRLEVAAGWDGELVGASRVFARCLELARAGAMSDAPVLILGETGTGKEMVARMIHDQSRRAGKAFVSLNCAALPAHLQESELFGHERGAYTGAVSSRAGRFEEADGGTIFLDEVGDCSPELQVKLLRVLAEKEFSRLGSNRRLRSDFRLVTATNRDLGAEVRAGRFREDLLFRINVIEVPIPPLRERMEDIPSLAWHFARKAATREGRPLEGISPQALERLLDHDWPGNVRELENAVHRAVILSEGPLLQAERLPPNLAREPGGKGETLPAIPGAAGHTLVEWERIVLRATLARCRGNKSQAARMLGISRKVLYSKMRRHQV